MNDTDENKIAEHIFTELTQLAMDRCHREYVKVAQLIPDDEQRVAMAILIAAEFMRGVEEMSGMSRRKAIATLTLTLVNLTHRAEADAAAKIEAEH